MTSALDRLGRVAVWSTAVPNKPAAELRENLAEYEALGYPAIWFGEAFSRENLSAAALTLSWTRELVVATGITNVYARDAAAAGAGRKTLGEAFPGRFVLGLGISHQHAVAMRGQEYGPPVTTMRAYLDAMEAAPYMGPEPPEPRPARAGGARAEDARPRPRPHRRCAPLLRPAGAHGAGPRAPRPGQAARPGAGRDPHRRRGRARELAREHCAFYLTAPNYRNNMLRLGFDESDLEDGGSDRLHERIVVWGDEDAIRARVKAHLDAGADHVCIQTLPSGELDLEALGRLAPALLDL